MPGRLLLVRHGVVAPEWQGRLIGTSDPPLSEKGCQQIAALVPSLVTMSPILCRVSPLRRARESAAILTTRLAWKFEVDTDLREVDFGRWEGRTFAEVQQESPSAVGRWASGDVNFSFPDGESLAIFGARVRAALERLLSADGTVVAVTHGGFIRAAICELLGLELRQYLLFDVQPGTINALAVSEGRGTLQLFNWSPILRDKEP